MSVRSVGNSPSGTHDPECDPAAKRPASGIARAGVRASGYPLCATYSGAVTAEALESTRSPSTLRSLVDRDALGAVVLTRALPFLFLHERYQPELASRSGRRRSTYGSRTGPARRRRCRARVALRLGTRPLAAGRCSGCRRAAPRLARLRGPSPRLARRCPLRRPPRELREARRVRAARDRGAAAGAARGDLTIVLGGLVLWSCGRDGRRAPPALRKRHLRPCRTRAGGSPRSWATRPAGALGALPRASPPPRIVAGRREIPAAELFAVARVGGMLGLILAGSVAAAGGLRGGGCGRSGSPPVGGSSRPRVGRLALAAVVVGGRAGVTTIRREALGDFLRFLGVHGDELRAGSRDVLAARRARVHRPAHRAGQPDRRRRLAALFPTRGLRAVRAPTRASASPTSSTSRSRPRAASGASRTSTSRCSPTPA